MALTPGVWQMVHPKYTRWWRGFPGIDRLVIKPTCYHWALPRPGTLPLAPVAPRMECNDQEDLSVIRLFRPYGNYGIHSKNRNRGQTMGICCFHNCGMLYQSNYRFHHSAASPLMARGQADGHPRGHFLPLDACNLLAENVHPNNKGIWICICACLFVEQCLNPHVNSIGLRLGVEKAFNKTRDVEKTVVMWNNSIILRTVLNIKAQLTFSHVIFCSVSECVNCDPRYLRELYSDVKYHNTVLYPHIAQHYRKAMPSSSLRITLDYSYGLCTVC